jgi:hypothetical protein
MILNKNLISPKCCTEVEKYKTVFLRYEKDPMDDYKYEEDEKGNPLPFVGYKNMKPSWAAKATSEEYSLEKWIGVEFCPHCGNKLPEIEMNLDVDQEKLANQDDDYCNTCNKRNMECRCLPPWFAWMPKSKKQ